MRKRIFTLTEKRIMFLKEKTTEFLKYIHDENSEELDRLLAIPTTLSPRMRRKGHLLFQPNGPSFCAYYIYEGLAKLYFIDQVSGLPRILHFWDAGSLICMDINFCTLLSNGDYFIELVEDATLVGVPNLQVGKLPCFLDITSKTMNLMCMQMLKQMDILLIEPKGDRLTALNSKFPGLRNRLSVDEICGFTGMSVSTVARAKS
ncbi:hypothetical protein ACVWYN_000424 [Pedobacter sp. UYP24]